MIGRIFDSSSYYFNPYALPMFITAFLIELFGLYILLQSKNRLNRSFFVLATSACIWQTGMGVLYLTKDTTLIIPFYNAFTFLGVATIAPGIYMFTVCCSDLFEEKKHFAAANYVLALTFYIANLIAAGLVTGIAEHFWGYYVIYDGPLTIPFLIFFVILIARSLYLLYQYEKQTKVGSKHDQIKLLLISLAIAVFGSVDFISAFPPFEVYPFGYIAILLFIAGQTYAIIRYQQASLNEIYHSLKEGLLVVDSQFRITEINSPAAAIVGLESHQLLGKKITDAVPLLINRLVDAKGINDLLKKFMANYSQIINEDIGLREPIQFINIATSPLTDRFGSISGCVVLLNDITERKMMEQELKQYQEKLEALVEIRTRELKKSEERYKALVAHAQIGIGIHREGKMIFANQQFLSMLGYAEEELIDMPISQLIHPDEVKVVMARAFDRYAGQRVIETYDIRLLRKDGTVLPAIVSNASIEYDGEKSTLITILDTTDSILRKKLEDSNQELEMFAYSVSHDLRAPLRSIDGFSQALQEDYAENLDEEGKDYLARIRAACEHMNTLINAILQLSRLSTAGVHHQDVNLSALAHEIAASLKESDRSRHVEFIIAEGITAIGDKNLLQVVMENLLGNAWKFTHKHKSAKIEFGIMNEGAYLIYFVRDDGVGFDMKYIDKLFTPFQRLHSNEDYEGTGIGLASVQRIIRLHGGKIWAESSVEKGSTFYFTLQ